MSVQRKPEPSTAKVPIDMTPMIDIVFQLLTFFIMTLSFVEAEGDFQIRMPLAAAWASAPTEITPPMKISLQASANGNLARAVWNGRNYQGVNWAQQLQADMLLEYATTGGFAKVEAELDCDYGLHYRHVMDAITAISGRVGKDGQTQRFVEKIKFSAPNQSPN